MRPSVTSSADGDAAASSPQQLVDLRPAALRAVAVHEDGVLLDGVGQLDERLELLRRGAVVADPVLREAVQLADASARRAARRGRAQEAERLTVAIVGEGVGGLHDLVEQERAAAPAEAQDLGLDVGRSGGAGGGGPAAPRARARACGPWPPARLVGSPTMRSGAGRFGGGRAVRPVVVLAADGCARCGARRAARTRSSASGAGRGRSSRDDRGAPRVRPPPRARPAAPSPSPVSRRTSAGAPASRSPPDA